VKSNKLGGLVILVVTSSKCLYYFLSVIILVVLVLVPISCSSSPDTDNDGWTNAKEAEMGTDPEKQDTDNDGLSDPHDSSPLDVRIPIDNTEFPNYHDLNQKVEYAIAMWLKKDVLSIVRDFSKLIKLPVANDALEKILLDALKKIVNWQVIGLDNSPNEKDIDVSVKLYLDYTIPEAAWENPPDISSKGLLGISCENLPKFGTKKYRASCNYNLIFYEADIIDYEIDNSSFQYEELE